MHVYTYSLETCGNIRRERSSSSQDIFLKLETLPYKDPEDRIFKAEPEISDCFRKFECLIEKCTCLVTICFYPWASLSVGPCLENHINQ